MVNKISFKIFALFFSWFTEQKNIPLYETNAECCQYTKAISLYLHAYHKMSIARNPTDRLYCSYWILLAKEMIVFKGDREGKC